MYMKVIPAVRGVHRKYLCRLTNMSEVCKYPNSFGGEKRCVGSPAYLTNAGSNVRAVRSMLALWLLEGFYGLHVRVLWPAMMRDVDDNRCLLRV